MHISLQNKIIFITGGTSALGRAFVRAARKEGADVYFSWHTNETEAHALEALGAHALRLDLADREGAEGVKAVLKKSGERLDILIHNAASTGDALIEKMTAEQFSGVIDRDLGAIFRLTKSLLPLLYKSEQGKIINVTSRAALRGVYGAANYAAAKAGVIAFTKSLAAEVGRKGILVNAVNPGFMISGMTRDLPEKVKERQKKESLLETWSDPEEVADFLVYLASDHVRRVTGQVFHYDSRGM